MDLNIDSKTLGECLKEITNIGSTTYVDICHGVSKTVPWGIGDYVAASVVGFLGLLVVAVLIILVIILISISKDNL